MTNLRKEHIRAVIWPRHKMNGCYLCVLKIYVEEKTDENE
jgi:hypothetical protein